MQQKENNHVIVALASSCTTNIHKLYSLMEFGRKVKRYGLTKNSVEADFGYNLSHPKLDEKNDMKIGIGKFSCIPDPKDKIIQPVCRSQRSNNFALCLFGTTDNLNQAAQEAKKNGTLFSLEAITPNGTTTTEIISRAEIFLKLILREKKTSIEKKVISIIEKIQGNYNLAFSINNQLLFIIRKGKGDPFYITKQKSDEFLCSSDIRSCNEKDIIQIVASNVIIKFTVTDKIKYKKIKLN